jgi:hypothetical protein
MNQNRKPYFLTLCKSTKILNPMPSKPFSLKVPKEKTKNHGIIPNIVLDYQANYIKYLSILVLKWCWTSMSTPSLISLFCPYGKVHGMYEAQKKFPFSNFITLFQLSILHYFVSIQVGMYNHGSYSSFSETINHSYVICYINYMFCAYNCSQYGVLVLIVPCLL